MNVWHGFDHKLFDLLYNFNYRDSNSWELHKPLQVLPRIINAPFENIDKTIQQNLINFVKQKFDLTCDVCDMPDNVTHWWFSGGPDDAKSLLSYMVTLDNGYNVFVDYIANACPSCYGSDEVNVYASKSLSTLYNHCLLPRHREWVSEFLKEFLSCKLVDVHEKHLVLSCEPKWNTHKLLFTCSETRYDPWSPFCNILINHPNIKLTFDDLNFILERVIIKQLIIHHAKIVNHEPLSLDSFARILRQLSVNGFMNAARVKVSEMIQKGIDEEKLYPRFQDACTGKDFIPSLHSHVKEEALSLMNKYDEEYQRALVKKAFIEDIAPSIRAIPGGADYELAKERFEIGIQYHFK